MKYILCVGVIAGFGYIGICIRNHLMKRVAFYNCLINFIDQFIINVNFLQLNFIECLNNEIEKESELASVLKYFIDSYIDQKETLKFKHQYLSEAELIEVFDCLQSIGTTDCANQISSLQGHKIKFEQRLAECSEKSKKYSGLAVKMSIIVGCLIVLILI